MRKVLLLFCLALLGLTTLAADKKKQKTVKLPSGLKYIPFIKRDSVKHPVVGDVVYYHLILKNHLDSVIFDTHKEFGPQQLNIEKSNFHGDLNEGIKLMSIGDSICFLIKTDSLYGSFMPHFAVKHKYMKFYITLLNFMSKENWKIKLKADYDIQAKKDDRLIHEYFAQKNKTPDSTRNGLYYMMLQKGNGHFPVAGDTITVNYTGKLTDGTVFDSNTDPKFRHVEPFQFVVGKGSVIKGWDEGLLTFDQGAKGTIIIPSGLAYGKRNSGIIPVNAILVFDIELVKISPKK